MADNSSMAQPHEPLVCIGARRCLGLSLQVALLATTQSSWRDALAPNNLTHVSSWKFGTPEAFCDQPNVRIAMSRSALFPNETWDMRHAVQRIQQLQGDLWFFANGSSAPPTWPGWVPSLLPTGLDVRTGWRTGPHGRVYLPGSTSRGEDAAVLRSFFSDFESGEPLRDGTFLEIGGFDGFTESNT